MSRSSSFAPPYPTPARCFKVDVWVLREPPRSCRWQDCCAIRLSSPDRLVRQNAPFMTHGMIPRRRHQPHRRWTSAKPDQELLPWAYAARPLACAFEATFGFRLGRPCNCSPRGSFRANLSEWPRRASSGSLQEILSSERSADRGRTSRDLPRNRPCRCPSARPGPRPAGRRPSRG